MKQLLAIVLAILLVSGCGGDVVTSFDPDGSGGANSPMSGGSHAGTGGEGLEPGTGGAQTSTGGGNSGTCTWAPAECNPSILGECTFPVSATYRDFSASHADFEPSCGGQDHISRDQVEHMLSPEGKPVRASPNYNCMSRFDDWYQDVSGVNATIRRNLMLFQDSDGPYSNRWGVNGEKWEEYRMGNDSTCGAEVCEHLGNPLYFPVDVLATSLNVHTATVSPPYAITFFEESTLFGHEDTGPHNFYFTSELSFHFEFDANKAQRIEVLGDDDVWVFINGRLAIDLGGVHIPVLGEADVVEAYGLVQGGTYEVKIFHAERARDGSSFRLVTEGLTLMTETCE